MFDNGTEFHDYAVLEERFTLKCYYATPYHTWERGSNENTNGLIRQYLPKGTCMSDVTQARCDHIANDLNTRPRKRHGYSTQASAQVACCSPGTSGKKSNNFRQVVSKLPCSASADLQMSIGPPSSDMYSLSILMAG